MTSKTILCILINTFLFTGAVMAENRPNIDLNKPVENPEFKEALQNYWQEQTSENKIRLDNELKNANFLIPILNDELHVGPAEENGKCVVKEDSVIKIVHFSRDGHNVYLPVFTDWNEIR